MRHEKHGRFVSIGRMTALASAIALSLGTLSLAGCGNDDDLPPVEQEPPPTEEQGSPMQDTTADPGIDQTDTAGGDGAEEPMGAAEPMPEDEDALPEAEQEPVPNGAQDTMAPDDEDEAFMDDDMDDDDIER